MIDRSEDVEKTFNDYQEESDISFIKIHLAAAHPWCGKTLRDLALPGELLVAMILRGGRSLVPDGGTVLRAGDLLVLAARSFGDRATLTLREYAVERGDRWAGKTLAGMDLPEARRVVLIRRGVETIIPAGGTVVQAGDILVLAESQPALQA